MRVLQINSVCGIGSTGRIATDIHNILIDQGHDSYIAYGRKKPLNCDTAIRIGNYFDNYAHVLKTRVFDLHGFGSKKATKEFIRKIIDIDPDVIHLHNIHGYYINVEILFDYLKKTNKPIVWTLHDCWPFTGHCAYFEYVGCECWKVDGCHRCIQKRSYPSSYFYNNSKSNYERKLKAFTGVSNLTIVTPSIWLERLVKQSFLKNYSVMVINNGIDLNVFKPSNSKFREKYNLENKYILLGVANVWEQRKGFNYFIELSSKLQEDEVIVLVGLSRKQLKNLPQNIIGISQTNNIEELAQIYTAADIYVNLTLEDNFPTTNLEALACGTPVITFDTGGSVESIDETCGVVVEKGNMFKLRGAIDKIKNNIINPDNCINRAQKYEKTKKFIEYINLYESIL